MDTLLLTLIAHTLADFLFQTHNVVLAKDRLQFSGFLTHGSLVFIFLAGLLSGYHWLGVLLYSLIITAAHLIIDFLKALLIRNRSCRVELTGFIADQILHFLVIILVWQIFDLQPDARITGLFNALISPKLMTVFKPAFTETGWSVTKVLGCILAYLTVCWGGAIFIQKFLRIFPCQNINGSDDSRLKETGRYIGILERALILTLVLNNSLTAVGFIFTAKSIARYNEMDDRDFAEYYLVGTLLSTAVAFGSGLVFRYLGKLI